MSSERLPPAVPESIYKDFVVLDGNWAHGAAQIKGSPLEHDAVLIVHTCAFWEDEKGCGVSSRHVGLHPFTNKLAVFDLQQ